MQTCGTALQKTWRQMTPFEQAKVEQEYFKLLKEESRRSLLQQSPEARVADLNSCLWSETAQIAKRPLGSRPAINLDLGAAAALAASLERRGYGPIAEPYAGALALPGAASTTSEDADWEYALR